MKIQMLVLVYLLSLGMFLGGCAKRLPPQPWVSKISMIKETVGPDEILRIPGGDPVSFSQLRESLEQSRVIFVGESHDQIEHHQIQARLIRTLVAKGKQVVIAMEMFERSRQPTLDRWSQGLLSEKEFLKEVDWDNAWSIDYDLYKPILDIAKEHRLKIVALNIERSLVREVAQLGLERLPPEKKAKLPEINLADKEHRAFVKSIYKGHHGGSAEDFNRFYQAQCLWDEGMAESLSDFLKSSEGEGKTVLAFVGSGHVVFGFGIPKRFYRRTPVPYQVIVLKTWRKKLDEDLSFTASSSPLADFLWITRPNPPEKKRPRIGVVLVEKEETAGLKIEKVLPGSPAEKAGLLPGDQLISAEGKERTTVKEVRQVLEEKGWGSDVTFVIIRDGTRKEIIVKLPPLQE